MAKRHPGLIVTLLVLLLIVPLNVVLSQSETGGKLIGFIYKSDKKTPMKDAKVILVNTEDATRYESNVTDDTGDYTIEGLPVGTYHVYLEINDKEFKIQKLDFLVRIEEGKTSYMSFSINKRFPFIVIIPVGSLAFIPASFSPTTR
jgi:hypothetical protein